MITVEDFKTYFYRDFPYLPVYDSTKTYNTGDEVYYETTNKFYKALSDGVTALPTDTTYWEVVTDNIYDYVLDADITRAIGEMSAMFPIDKFKTDEAIRLGELYLTAHCLVNDIRTANGGLVSQFPFPLQSKSVGSISQSYGIPRRFLDREIYSFYITSQYGLKYLALVIPRMIGNISVAFGATTP